MSRLATSAEVPPRRFGLAAGWETLIVFLVGLACSFLNAYLCLAVFSGLVCWLIVRHYHSPADVIGIVFTAGCAAPLFRRVHDLFHGYQPGSLLLVAQYIAYPLLGVFVIRDLDKFRQSRFLPLVVSLVGIVWAYCVGLLDVGIFPASMQLLEFVSGPILFAYLVVLIDRFDVEKFSKWLLVLGGIEGAYGIYQWVFAPPWDGYWFNMSGMATAGGYALPYQLRTFGTLNSTSPYAYFLFFVLVVTIRTRGYILVAPLMLGGLATTLGRSTWGATLLGWMVILLVARGKDKLRAALPLGAMLLMVTVVALPFASNMDELTKRLESMTDLKNDNSFKDRSGLLDAAIRGGAFDDPIGVGFGLVGAASKVSGKGVTGIDNGFLATAWVFGWIGSFFFLGGILLGMFRAVQGSLGMPLIRVQYLGALAGLFAANMFEPAFSGFKGPLVWLSIGITNMWVTERYRLKASTRKETPAWEPELVPEAPEVAGPVKPASVPDWSGRTYPDSSVKGEPSDEIESLPDLGDDSNFDAEEYRATLFVSRNVRPFSDEVATPDASASAGESEGTFESLPDLDGDSNIDPKS